MPTKVSKTAVKKPEVKTAKAEVPRKRVIQKKVAEPKQVEKKQRQHTQGAKKFFTIKEDLEILEEIKSNENKNKSEQAKTLAARLGRQVEAIRDRIKRYISKLSQSDQKELTKEAKRVPSYFIHFKKNADGTRKIEKFSPHAPSLQNREFNRKPRTAGTKKAIARPRAKTGVPKNALDQKYAWVHQRLHNSDAYFTLDFSVKLLIDIFNSLLEQNLTTVEKIDELITQTYTTTSLEEIFAFLKIKSKE